MGDNSIVEFPTHNEAEIALAERAYEVVDAVIDTGELPADAVPKGDVSELLDAVGNLMILEIREEEGRRVSEKSVTAALERLRSAIGAFESWPMAARAQVIAPLVETFEEQDLQWLAGEMMTFLPNVDFLSPHDQEITASAFRRILPVHIRMVIDEDEWMPEIEDLLRLLRHLVQEEQEDDDLNLTFKKAIIFHAWKGREHIQLFERRKLATAEPLPNEIAKALDDFAAEAFDKEIVGLSLHLVMVDALAAGVIPEWAKPRHIVAAVFLALVARDDPETRLDRPRFAQWARIKPKKLKQLQDAVEPAFDWIPSGSEQSLLARQMKRWMTLSVDLELMPARWVPDRETGLPPYTTEAAKERLDELGEVVWMMIDGFEAVRFVSEAFEYGGEAPDEIDEEIALEAISVWKREHLVDIDIMGQDLDLWSDDEDDFLDSELDDDWENS